MNRSSISGRFVSAAQAFRNPDTTVVEKRYPHFDGDVTVIGPQAFLSADGTVINYRGVNYRRESEQHGQ